MSQSSPSFCFAPNFPRIYQTLFFIGSVMFLSACSSQGRTVFYSASGQPSHTVHCSMGEYESCLHQAGDLCGKDGYSILEKIRQTKSSFWFNDAQETLLVAQCKANAEGQNKSSDPQAPVR